MNVSEALMQLESAPQSTTKPAAINRGLTQKQAVDIVRRALLIMDADEELKYYILKRFWQVKKNQKRPKY